MTEVETPVALPSTRRDRQASAPNVTTTSRPLSEISDNNGEHRRSTTRESLKSKSRPSSEVKDLTNEREAKRASIGGQHTITLNLNDYASAVAKRESPIPPSSPPVAFDGSTLSPSIRSPPNASIVWGESSGTDVQVEHGPPATVKGKEKAADVDLDELMPSSTSISAFDAIASPSPPISPTPPIVAQNTLAPPVSSSVSSASFDTARSSIDLPPKPPTKAKPNWLRKASGSSLAVLRSRSPKNDDSPSLPAQMAPPSLPPRKSKSPLASTVDLPPPPVPYKPLHGKMASSASTMDLRSASIDQPGQLPHKPSRDNIGRRIAAWTASAQSAFPRSSSSASLASQASSPPGLHPAHQRTHSQAQKVFDSAGAAVQKGLAGLRTRGMGGSISSLSALSQPSRRGPSDTPPPVRPRGFGARTMKERSQSSQIPLAATSEEFENAIVMRVGTPGANVVFGRDLVEAGQCTHVMDANAGDAAEKRRRHCLPSLVVRCVEYLELWGPREEGIFRISGRSSHMHRLKKEFDSGADIDMRQCHPGDLDPHAVAGLFKWYLRDMPSSILTPALSPLFDSYAKARQGPSPPMPNPADLDRQAEHTRDELDELLAKLPPAHWFLLADIVKLLDLIPRHVETNRMTLNALMISLGPSLNIPGGVINELLMRRTTLFAKPPPTEEDGVTDLIDFGSVSIAPPSIPQAALIPLKDEEPTAARSATPLSQASEDSPPSKGTRPGRMPSKPSLTRLFTASSRNLQLDSQPAETPSVVDPEPPRVDLTIDEMSPLPNFGKVPSPAQPPDDLPTSPEEIKASDAADEDKPAEDTTCPPGTVQERINAYPISSTPIADRFAKEVSLPPLRPNSLTSTASTVSDKRASFKRGQQAFFSSSTSPRTHSRSQSGSLDKRSSASSSVRDMVKDMERREVA